MLESDSWGHSILQTPALVFSRSALEKMWVLQSPSVFDEKSGIIFSSSP